MKFQKPGSIVVVDWNDSLSYDPWEDVEKRLEEHNDSIPIKTVGIVLQHNEDKIIVARSFHEKDHTCEGTFEIPTGMITGISKLTYKVINVKGEPQ
jgi:hypothetical protein